MIRWMASCTVGVLGAMLVGALVLLALLEATPPIRAVDPSPIATPEPVRTAPLIPPVTTTPRPTP